MDNKAPLRVFADDMAVTSKYWETVIRKKYSQPEKELMLAVLKDAIMNYKKRMHLGNALFKEAETWLFERERDRLFSFERVCAVLGMRPVLDDIALRFIEAKIKAAKSDKTTEKKPETK